MHSTPPSPEEIHEHVAFVVGEVQNALARYDIAATVVPTIDGGARRVVVTLDVNRPVLRRPDIAECHDL